MSACVTRIILFGVCATLLTACSWMPKPSFIQNRDLVYLSAKSVPPLRIPPGLESNEFHNYYPIPDRGYPGGAMNVSLSPPGLQ